jgi:hypothetical protein
VKLNDILGRRFNGKYRYLYPESTPCDERHYSVAAARFQVEPFSSKLIVNDPIGACIFMW